MPKAYESMRDKFKTEGMSDASAKTKAAKIYNSSHSDKVTSTPHYNTQESAEGDPSPMMADMNDQIKKAN